MESGKMIYTVAEIRVILGIGKNQAYKLVKSGAFATHRFGNRLYISKCSFDQWLNYVSDVKPTA